MTLWQRPRASALTGFTVLFTHAELCTWVRAISRFQQANTFSTVIPAFTSEGHAFVASHQPVAAKKVPPACLLSA